MANALITAIATRINAAVDIPAVPEGFEQAAIEASLELAVGKLPPTYLAWVQSAADGIDDAEAESVKAWLLELMSEHGTSVPLGLRTWAAGAVVFLLRKGVSVAIE
jgi:hypothetical protein